MIGSAIQIEDSLVLLHSFTIEMAFPVCTRFSSVRLSLCSRPSGAVGRSHVRRNLLTVCQICKVAVLPGDGIGPEISKVAVALLRQAGEREDVNFQFTEAPIGGAAIDATGSPLPEETLQICRQSDAVLLAAIGGCVI